MSELTGMWWVQGAACAYAFDDSINRNGMNPRFSASESSSALLFHSTRTTAVLHAGARLVDTSRALGGADHSHKPSGVTARGSAQKYFDWAAG